MARVHRDRRSRPGVSLPSTPGAQPPRDTPLPADVSITRAACVGYTRHRVHLVASHHLGDGHVRVHKLNRTVRTKNHPINPVHPVKASTLRSPYTEAARS